jgi:hypothetical protein
MLFFIQVQPAESLADLRTDHVSLQKDMITLRDEVRRDRELSLSAHEERDDCVDNQAEERSLKLTGFRPNLQGLQGEALYKRLREEIHGFLKGITPTLEFQVLALSLFAFPFLILQVDGRLFNQSLIIQLDFCSSIAILNSLAWSGVFLFIV